MLRRIRTYTRREAAALTGITALSAGAVLVFVAALLAGDQRRVEVLGSDPGPGTVLPSGVRAITIEFGTNVDREAAEELVSLEPEFPAQVRWRGARMDLVPDEALEPGSYLVRVAAGTAGRGGERLREPFELAFEVREPTVLTVVPGEEDALVRVTLDGESDELVRAPQVVDYAASPGGRFVAVITADTSGLTRLQLLDTIDGTAEVLVEQEDIGMSWARWAPDGEALLVLRRDQLPDGSFGVGRTWLMRVSGEFVGPLDSEGEPTLAARWSPNGDRIAYVAPATARLVVLHTATQERIELGTPRGVEFDWAPFGDRIAFEAAPGEGETGLVQPVRVRSLDLATDITIGMPGEIVSRPRWLDVDRIAVLWRETGPDSTGTQLWFLSLPSGERMRAIQLSGPQEAVTAWDLDPAGNRIVYSTTGEGTARVTVLDLDTNERRELPISGVRATWLP